MITKEEALAELKARGIDPSNPPTDLSSSAPSGVSKEEAMAELRARGVDIPQTTISQDHPTKRMISNFVHSGLDLGGMVGGGALGGAAGALTSPITGPVGPLGGAVAGAGLGYAALHPLGQAFDEAIGAPGTPPQPTLGQQTAAIPSDILTGMAGELGGRAITKAVTPLAEGLSLEYKPDLEALAKELKTPIDLATKTGSQALARLKYSLKSMPMTGVLQDADAATRDALQAVREKIMGKEASAEQAPFVGNQIINTLKGASQDVTNATSNEGKQLAGQSVQDIPVAKQAIQDIVNSSNQHKALVDQLYGQANRIAGSDPSELPSGTAKADELFNQLKGVTGSNSQLMSFINDLRTKPPTESPALSLGDEFKNADPKLLEAIKQRAIAQGGISEGEHTVPSKTFGQLQQTISNLKELAAKENASIGTNAPGMKYQSSPTGRNALQLANALEDDLHSFGGGKSDQLKQTLSAAKTMAKQGYDKYNSDVLSLAKQDPEYFIDKAIVPGNVTDTKNLMSIVSPETKEGIKQALNQRIFSSTDGQITREAVAKNLAKYGDTLNEVYSPKELDAMRGFAADRSNTIADHPTFQKFLVDTANTHPAAVVDYFMQPNFGDSIGRVRSVIGEDKFGDLQNQALLKMSNAKDGSFSPTSYANAVDKMKPDTFKALFSGDKFPLAQKMYQLSDAIRKSEGSAVNLSGTSNASMFRRLMMTAVYSPAKAAGYIGAGSIASNLYASPVVGDAMVAGSKALQNVPGLAGVSGREAIVSAIDKLKSKYDQRRKF